ncbi:N-acetylmuramoyl-L-alanine amidase family protein [Cohnella caldifontis]|uniref:N-acetylmuramoyl-L-alanine amidase family protein n=1 Tax=Cohnella caldifontis TaxID=3027471 RepID=UPI0023ED1EF3|nr:N-acetylmuramoyl-L-alanine amidase family protein [Cohnella sp. YIM B05605]
MKKWISLLFVTALMLFAGVGWTSAAAQKTAPTPVQPKLYLNGKELASEVPPALVHASVLVPIRTVAENLGYKVGWDGKKKQVSVKEGSTEILMTLNDPKAKVNGKTVQMTEPPVLQSETTLIPIRFVGETFGLQILWDNGSKSAFLFTDAETKPADGSQTGGQTADNAGNGTGGGTGTDKGADSGSGSATGSTSGSGANAGNGQSDAGSTPATGSGSGASSGSGTQTGSNPSDGGLIGVVEPGEGDDAAGGTGNAAGANGSGTTDTPGNPGSGTADPNAATAPIHQFLYEPNLVTVTYDGSIAPVTNVLTGPDRIVIDLPNADFADDFAAGFSNGITPGFMTVNAGRPAPGTVPELTGVGHEALDKIRYSLFTDSPKTVRIVLDLNQPWGYEVDTKTSPNHIFIRLKKPEAETPAPAKSGYTVVLDAGHGGSDPGARSITGKWEKDFTLAVVKKVQAILSNEPKINLVLTRDADTYPTLDDRVNLANNLKADLFLSVHGNSFTASTNGTETYYTRADSLAFAKLLHKNAVAATGFKDNGVRTANYKVTRATTMPAVLLEVGYLTHTGNEKQLYSAAFQDRVAAAIAASIKQYFNLS